MSKNLSINTALGIACLLVMSCSLSEMQELEKMYQSGNLLQARKVASDMVKDPQQCSPAEVILAEILLQENESELAEKHLAHALQCLQQARHDGDKRVLPWLGRLFYVKGLLRLSPALNTVSGEDSTFWLNYYLEPARESFAEAFQIDPTHPRWKAAMELVEAAQAQKTQNSPQDRRAWVKWQSFVEREPLLQRLVEREVEVQKETQIPSSQIPIRQCIQQWQVSKRQAFLQKDPDSLKTILTGTALTDTVMAVSWWKDRPSSDYWDIQLHKLKFIKITYSSPESASAEVELDETRDNSEEGRQRSQYKAIYQLQKISGDWLISDINVQ